MYMYMTSLSVFFPPLSLCSLPFPILFPSPFSSRLKAENSDLNTKLTTALQIKAAAEAKLADFEKEKMMIELDIKEIIARHKTEVTEKMAWSSKVSFVHIYHHVYMYMSVCTCTCRWCILSYTCIS